MTESPSGLFQVPHRIRARHVYIIGKTRTGKTTLIKNIIIQDMQQGAGVAFLDPHGDAAKELLGNVPAARIPEAIYFDPSSPAAPAFNPLRLPYEPPKLTEDLISVFKLFFGDSWGYRMENILRQSFLTLILQKEPRTFYDLRRLLINKDFRADVVRTTEQESLREFWEVEFPTIEKAAVNPVINKLSALLAPTSPLERIFSEKENDLDFSHILNTGKIFIVNLSKGIIGDEPSRLLGGFITTGIQQAALARATIPEAKRKPFYLFIDEFQNYAVKSIDDILAESGKYRLFLTLANQTLEQVSHLQHAIFGNVGTLVSFQVAAKDAAKITEEMHSVKKLCRRIGAPQFLPLDNFISYAVPHLKAERARFTESARTNRDAALQNWYVARARECQQLLRDLQSPALTFEQIRDISRVEFEHPTIDKDGYLSFKRVERQPLFPKYEFIAQSFPEIHDLTNLPRFYAFARVERAEKVFRFKTLPSPPPNEKHRARILSLMQERHAARHREAAALNRKASEPPRPKEKPPTDEEDFKF